MWIAACACRVQLQLLTCPVRCQDVEDHTNDDEDLPVKRSKHFADKNVPPRKAVGESASAGSKRKSPAKSVAAEPSIAKAAKALPTSKKPKEKAEKAAGKGRKTIVIDDDSDDDFQVRGDTTEPAPGGMHRRNSLKCLLLLYCHCWKHTDKLW